MLAHDGQTLVGGWLATLALAAASGSSLGRAVLREHERVPWLVVGAGLAGGTTGTALVLTRSGLVGRVPGIEEMLVLSSLTSLAGVLLLVQMRPGDLVGTLWLDGVAGALAVAALATWGLSAIDSPSTALGEGYALLVLSLPATAVFLLASSGWKPGRMWARLATGLLILGGAQALLIVRARERLGLLEAGLVVAGMLITFAPWLSDSGERSHPLAGWQPVAFSSTFSLASLGILISGSVVAVPASATALASLSLFAVVARTERGRRILTTSQREASTDALTGLANRRKLTIDLQERVDGGGDDEPLIICLLDLNGFKRYNDTFGHPAGDELLARFGRKLEAAVARYGRAYRMGGDEFCVVASVPEGGDDALISAVVEALHEEGEVPVGCSLGLVRVPAEAASAADALRIADTRLYFQKNRRRTAVGPEAPGFPAAVELA